MFLGANWPYDRLDWRDDAFVSLVMLAAQEVVIMSHASQDDYQEIARLLPGIRFDVRMKTGHSHLGMWPSEGIDYREWPSEQSARDALYWCLNNGQACQLILGNEPDIEMAREPVDDPTNMVQAILNYREWAERVIDQVRGDPRLAGVPIVSTPLSQGNPARFDQWWYGALDDRIERCDVIGEHCYVNGRSFDDPEWGGRFAVLAERNRWDKPIGVYEVNTNGVGENEEVLPAYLRYVESTGLVECVSLFTLAGGAQDGNKPEWWFLSIEALSAAAMFRELPGDVAHVDDGAHTALQQQQEG